MSGCTATIRVDGQTITCTSHDDLSMYTHSDGLLGWSDLAPGATPAKPKYRTKPFGSYGGWRVENERGHAAASFYGSEHPDARQAAEAEAARLNGDDPSHEDWQQAVLHQQQAVRERDAAREALKIVKVSRDLIEQECHLAYEQRDEARATADRYREALKRISTRSPDASVDARVYACFVLDGGQP